MGQYGDRKRQEELRTNLKTIPMRVHFLKQDGSNRVMIATQDEARIPCEEIEHLKNGSGRAANPDVCVVWDLEAQGWRSFRYDSILTATPVLLR